MYRNNFHAFVVVVLALLAAAAQGLPEDAKEEITILSDSAELDRKSGIYIYKGNVVLTQGTLRIESDRLMIIRSGNVLEKAVAEGNPARFQQQISIDQGLTHAQGDRIDYFAVRKKVHITGDGRMQQEGNEFNGETIIYDIANKTVRAKSTQADDVGAEVDPQQRIKVVIQPEKEQP
ncbi:hypothetical protein A3759_16895 [Thalassolituus sp. HI0120]|nr:hypothetical protein A3759_16895 [Thalassolituus sp. HI0120]